MKFLFLLLLFPAVVNATTHYISTTGKDNTDCSSGTESNPWLTWNFPEKNGCILPGDTVYFKEGTYDSDGGIFNGYTWDIHGTEGNKIRVAPDPNAPGNWPVKFVGLIHVFGEQAVIDGFEFDGDGGVDSIKNFASHITYQNNYVHNATKDCIRNLQTHYPGGEHNTDMAYIGNIVSDCGEDAIDNTGAKNVVIRGNDFSNYASFQIKLGTENVVIENNVFHDAASAFSCNEAIVDHFVGNPTVPNLPVEDRFCAKNVTIRNNIFYNIYGWSTIKPLGWIDSQIYNNTFYNLGKWAFVFQSTKLVYDDEDAALYCARYPSECEDCGDSCYRITVYPKNIQIRNNVVFDHEYMVMLDSSIYPLNKIQLSNNIYHNGTGVVRFHENGVDRMSLSTFTVESDSYEQYPGLIDPSNYDFRPSADSITRDNGSTLISIDLDYSGNQRDGSPDIGAIEYPLNLKAPPKPLTLNVL